MPTMPRPLCLVSSCRNRATLGSRKCVVHREPVRDFRPTATQRGYGSKWARTSIAVRRDQPWCDECLSVEDLTVDHIIPLSRGGTHERGNLRTLCRSCHGRRTAASQGDR